MYKIKMKTIMMGPNIRAMTGDIIDVDDDMGKHLIKAKSADLIKIIPDETETAMIQPVENAMLQKPKGKKLR